ncbi:MAG: Ig-like domain-containing protein [Myxococcota bacterium]
MRRAYGIVVVGLVLLGCPSSNGDLVPPTVALTSSTGRLTITGSVTLTAVATDDQGVKTVEFFDGATLVGAANTSPYSLAVPLNGQANGTHQFTARATDLSGNVSAPSNAAIVVVDIDITPPSISLQANPTTVIASPGNLTLTATATDDRGVAKVEFYEEATRISEVIEPPFTHSVTSLRNGTHVFTARAFDLVGNVTTSTPVTVTFAVEPPAVPPAFAVNFGLKSLRFSWGSVANAEHYELFEDPDGAGPASIRQVGGNLSRTTFELPVAVHRLDWTRAVYFVRACHAYGCSAPSSPLGVAAGMLRTVGYLKASNTNPGDSFGSAIAISGDGRTLAVAARGESSAATGVNGDQSDNSKQNSGAVYIFTWGPNDWIQQAFIKASNTDANDQFGESVALNGDGSVLAVGCSEERSATTGINGDQTDNSAIQSGAVYVFTRAGTSWSQQAYLKASNAEADDFFGTTVALSHDGRTLAVAMADEDSAASGVGGNQTDNSKRSAGAVYIFQSTGAAWSQEAYIKASNPDIDDYFGLSISLSADGNTLAVGAEGEDSVPGNQLDNSIDGAGAVYVFARSGGNWAQQAFLKASNAGTNDAFGRKIDLADDGNTLVVTAPSEDSGAAGVNGSQSSNSALSSGAAYVFVRVGAAWSQQAYLKASNTGAGDYFGMSISISGDGSTIAVASYEDSAAIGMDGDSADNSAPRAGAVYLFARDGSTWKPTRYVKAPNTNAYDYFGYGVALNTNGDALFVGAFGESSSATGLGGTQTDNSMPNAGAVYLF